MMIEIHQAALLTDLFQAGYQEWLMLGTTVMDWVDHLLNIRKRLVPRL
jgi:hypothetical protein